MKQAFHLRRDPYACAAVTTPQPMYTLTIPRISPGLFPPTSRRRDRYPSSCFGCRTRKAGIKYPLLQRKGTSGGDAEGAGTQSGRNNRRFIGQMASWSGSSLAIDDHCFQPFYLLPPRLELNSVC